MENLLSFDFSNDNVEDILSKEEEKGIQREKTLATAQIFCFNFGFYHQVLEMNVAIQVHCTVVT